MSPRFTLSAVAVVAGAFLTAISLAFRPVSAGWVAFGVSTGVAVVTLTAAVVSRRSSAKTGHASTALVSLWSLIAALAFHGSALHWLVFADAIGLATVALGDLIANEVSLEHAARPRLVPGMDTGQQAPPATRAA